MEHKFYIGDNVEVLKECIQDESIDLTVTSPPYDDLRTYKGFEWDIDGVIEQLWRVTKDGGVVVWVVGDKTHKGSETGTSFRTALKFMDYGWRLHDTMIYHKNNPTPMQGKRYQQTFEYMFVFSKNTPKTFNPITTEKKYMENRKNKQYNKNTEGKQIVREYKAESKQRTLRNIWSYSVGLHHTTKDRHAFTHPAIFPEQLVEDHILSWSNEGDIVLDLFGGSGTVAKVAELNKRNSIYIDISEEYCTDIAIPRLNEYKDENSVVSIENKEKA